MNYKILFTVFFAVILLTSTATPGLSSAYAEKEKTTICHVPKGNPGNAQTISVSSSSLNAHLNHGDSIGKCTSSNQDQSNKSSSNNSRTPSKKITTICHNPSGNPENANTMTIFSYQLGSHLDHRDSIGACKKIDRQDNKIKYSSSSSLERKVLICHIPPDFPQYARTLSISYSASSYHHSHGDQDGKCDPEILPPGITTFFGADNSVEKNPFLKELPNPMDSRVTICHTPIGNTENPRTITISRTALNVHLNIGDALGECTFDGTKYESPNKTITLCHFTPGKYNKEGIPKKQFSIVFNSYTYQNIVIKNSKLGEHLENNPYDYPGYCSANANENFEKCTSAFSFWTNYFEQKQYGNIDNSYSISQYASTFSDYQEGDTFLPEGSTPLENNNKVTITHTPPGNPDNSHEITVSENALKGHEKHDDDEVSDTSESKGKSDSKKSNSNENPGSNESKGKRKARF